MDEGNSNLSSAEGTNSPASAPFSGRKRNSSFIASLLGRSLSLSDDYNTSGMQIDDQTQTDSGIRFRQRSQSLCEDDDSVDGKDPEQRRRRQRTFSLLGNSSGNVFTGEDSGVFDASPSSNQDAEVSSSSQTSRETSQTDHLNKKLLSTFLTRINSMATNFIDPSGTGQNVGEVYSDDVVMDRILRHVENSNSSSSLNNNDVN